MAHYAKVKDGKVIAVMRNCPVSLESSMSSSGWRKAPEPAMPDWAYNEDEDSFIPPPIGTPVSQPVFSFYLSREVSKDLTPGGEFHFNRGLFE